MGNIVVFRREADLGPLGASNGRRPVSSEGKELPTRPEPEMPQSTPTERLISATPSSVFRHFGLTQFAQGTVEPASNLDHDGFLLVLLADQEFTAGRNDEARSLLDAAYAAYDRKTGDQQGCLARG